jgi:hypothetical protein
VHSPERIKQELISYLRKGRKADAIAHAQQQLKISYTDAERLIQSLESELTRQDGVPSSVPAVQGCAALLLKGFSIFFGFIAAMLLLAAATTWYEANHYAEKAIRITGTVVDLQPESPGSKSKAPVVEYEYNGERLRYNSTFYSSPPSYYIGEEVIMLINPENSEQVIIDSFSERYALPLIFGIVGSIFLFITIGLTTIRRKMKKSVVQ